MPLDRIKTYINTKEDTSTIVIPSSMTYSGLIRLSIPQNLESEGEPNPALPASKVSDYKLKILANYRVSLNSSLKAVLSEQLARISEEGWSYHRLTNFIKTLPLSESIVIVKLMTTGILHNFEPSEFIDLMSLLLYRQTQGSDSSSEPSSSELSELPYYRPKFERFPNLMEEIKGYINYYELDIDLDKPVHSYFSQYCFAGKQYLEHMERIQDMGEWLYIFKKGIMEIAPLNNKKEPVDKLAQLIVKVDSIYMASVSRKKTLEL
jgi:hypothetical protein